MKIFLVILGIVSWMIPAVLSNSLGISINNTHRLDTDFFEYHSRLDSVFEMRETKVYYDDHAYGFNTIRGKNEIQIKPKIPNLLSEKYHTRIDTFFIQSILAHEYGHLLQSKRKMNFSGTSLLRKELQADLLAGYYLSNYYRNTYLNLDISDQKILSKVDRFFAARKANPDLYLILAILINDTFDYDYSDATSFDENTADDVRYLRCAAVFQGFRFSELKSIIDVYSQGLEYVDRLQGNKLADSTFVTLKVLGLQLIVNTLNGTYDRNTAICNCIERLQSSTEPIVTAKFSYYLGILKHLRDIAPFIPQNVVCQLALESLTKSGE